jgi:hypothetical protein
MKTLTTTNLAGPSTPSCVPKNNPKMLRQNVPGFRHYHMKGSEQEWTQPGLGDRSALEPGPLFGPQIGNEKGISNEIAT